MKSTQEKIAHTRAVKKKAAERVAALARGVARNAVLQGDVVERLRELPAESVHCIVTSPPYWGLRDYNAAGQMGMERRFEDYLRKMRALGEELLRVLRKDGTLWLNMGDCYAVGGCGARDPERWPKQSRNDHMPVHPPREGSFKKKDLVGQPWEVAFLFRALGFYLRRDIVWHKPNAMPESCKDRPAAAHEYLLLLTKSPRYFYDDAAVKQPVSGQAHPRGAGVNPKALKFPDNWMQGPGPHEDRAGGYRHKQNESFSAAVKDLVAEANLRSVWTIPTQPNAAAHFATFPEELVRLCLSAGTSAYGVCAECGAPWRRVVAKGRPLRQWQQACGGDAQGEYARKDGEPKQDQLGKRQYTGFNERWKNKQAADYAAAGAEDPSAVKSRILAGMAERRTVEWRPTCAHVDAPRARPLVLDPFLGSGTTAKVALDLGCDWLGIELNPQYVALIEARLEGVVQSPLLSRTAAPVVNGQRPAPATPNPPPDQQLKLMGF